MSDDNKAAHVQAGALFSQNSQPLTGQLETLNVGGLDDVCGTPRAINRVRAMIATISRAGLWTLSRPVEAPAGERCPCGNMTKADCDALPGFRHCGLWNDETPPPSAEGVGGAEAGRDELLKELEAEKGYTAQWEERYRTEYAIVDRVWKALGNPRIETLDGKAIDQLVAEAVAAAEAVKILTDLYNSEINANLSWFFDSGFDVILGDRHNGVIGTHNESNLLAAVLWLRDAAIVRYPDSEFAKKYRRK